MFARPADAHNKKKNHTRAERNKIYNTISTTEKNPIWQCTVDMDSSKVSGINIIYLYESRNVVFYSKAV